jgi:hypothetical protein
VEIQTSKKFLSDLNRYDSALNKIEAIEIKEKLQLLIKQLTSEVKKLDFQHQDYVVNRNSLTDVNDIRFNIQSIRTQIEQIIKSIV